VSVSRAAAAAAAGDGDATDALSGRSLYRDARERRRTVSTAIYLGDKMPRRAGR